MIKVICETNFSTQMEKFCFDVKRFVKMFQVENYSYTVDENQNFGAQLKFRKHAKVFQLL